MSRSRRQFLLTGSAALMAAAAASQIEAQVPSSQSPSQPPQQPGAPPAFGTAPAVGPETTPATFAEAEKLVRVEMTPKDLEQAASNWRNSMAALYEHRTGPRKLSIPDTVAPYAQVDPVLPGMHAGPATELFARSTTDAGPLPGADADIAFAPVWKLARWIQSRKLTSTRLTNIYLKRIEEFDPKLRCVITLTRELALKQAQQADQEIAAGKYRGPLHGIPWGGKDLLDTAGIATTYGAEPFRDRIPTADAAVVARLHKAGAVMLAKLSLGALALNDVWFGGQTMNPWLLVEGSSGSSAGPGSATSAGLVAFSIGSETEGSITSPSARCGITGLRPTYGRVPRNGAMTLCWSLDKLGPMTRSVEDTMLVLHAIAGPDAADLGSRAAKLHFDAGRSVKGIRVGYFPAWMKEAPASEVDRKALDVCQQLGMTTQKVELPDWPFDDLNILLFAEAAAAFEELTLSHKVDQLRMQVADAWPNSFRQARFLSAVDYVQMDRFRRMVAAEMARIFNEVDVLLVPSLRDEMLTISNFTGHPSLTMRAGFVEITEARSDWAPDPAHPLPKFDPPRRVPQPVTLIGKLFDEGTVASVGMALEKALKVSDEQPPGF